MTIHIPESAAYQPDAPLSLSWQAALELCAALLEQEEVEEKKVA